MTGGFYSLMASDDSRHILALKESFPVKELPVEVLKETLGLLRPRKRRSFQSYLDFASFCLPSKAEGIMIRVGGERMGVSFHLLEKMGFEMGRADTVRLGNLGAYLEKVNGMYIGKGNEIRE